MTLPASFTVNRRSGLKAAMAALVLFAAAALPGRAAAQESGAQEPGAIVGKVLSARTAEPLAAVQVFVPGTGINALTGVDGRYLLRDVPAGTHHVQARTLGYAQKTVTGVRVTAGKAVTLDVSLETQTVEIESITVTATAERGSATALLSERKRSAVMVDAISAEQISRSPDGDAGAALKRVPGLSVVDGKYAYVRGLGERYSSTTLNGAPLASPVPDKKAIPMDVIPSSLLESIVTSKTYSPDQPGDFAGGLVQLRTRAFPAARIFRISASAGYDTEASFQEGLGYSGGNLNAFGFGGQDLPDIIPADRRVSYGTGFSREQLEEIGQSFTGDWGPTAQDVPMNYGLGVTYGDETQLFGRRFGLLGSLTWSNDFGSRADQLERVYSSQGEAPEVDYLGQTTTRSVTLGGLLNASVKLTDTDQITLATVYNRLAENEARQLQGFNLDSNTNQRNTRIRYLGQTLLNSQLSGEHVLQWARNTTMEWRGAYTRASRFEPNTREVLYRQTEGGQYVFDTFIQSGSIFHQDMVDDGWSGALSLQTPFTFRELPANVGVGVALDTKDRDAYTRRFRFLPVPGGTIGDEQRALAPNELLAPENIHINGLEIQEATFPTDNYSARERIDAAYAKVDLEVMEGVRLVGGARLERSNQEVQPLDRFGSFGSDLVGADLEKTAVLPAVNLTISASENVNIRASASRTLARPQLRELAPFSFADYAGGFLVVGNPQLKLSRIDNFDLRYEWFFGGGDLFAVSGFYKRFADPIEVLVLPSTELIKTWANAESADNFGTEIELRVGLGALTGALDKFAVNANLTLVQSEVNTGTSSEVYVPGSGPFTLEMTDRDRPLQGQSPYVVNAGLTYFDVESETSATLLFNRFGERIDAIGREATPDILEEARNQLDLTLERAMGNGLSVKLSASRLLGSQVEFTQGGQLVRAYNAGRSISLSASLKR